MNRRILNYGRPHQLGMTLIEVILAMGISAVIIGGISGVIYQIIMNNMRSTSHMVAVKQVENALHFMLRDIQMAQVVQIEGLPENERLKLSWKDWNNTNYVVIYSLDDGVLSRNYSAGEVTAISRYIANLEVENISNELKISIRAAVQDSTAFEIREIGILPRNSY
jgi:prepilin-type N-terminal cleavage/methylation domain-containing protein